MIAELSNNSFLAELFGPGVARGVRAASTASHARRTTPIDVVGAYPQPVDSVELSEVAPGERSARETSGQDDETTEAAKIGQPQAAEGQLLSDEQQREVRKLKNRDAEVRRHEQAHKAAAGGHATGGPSFEYTTGPDGRRYAVGGEVGIDTSEVSGDPQATIAKMQQIRRAAQAPADPSSQDRAVAAQAAAAERKARAELAKEDRARTSGAGTKGDREPGSLLDLLA